MNDNTVAVSVVIPTYKRGRAVLNVLKRINACNPRPIEIIIHIDSSDGELESLLMGEFKKVKVLTSSDRLGPGGGRHKCFSQCTTPYAVSFDDDSFPVDADFFKQVVRLFTEHDEVAIFGASIWHRNQPEIPRSDGRIRVANYIGCGFAIRLSAYWQLRGYLPLPIAYEMEESDVSLQLFARGWRVETAKSLRVFHDTELKHHDAPEITIYSIMNIALRVYLNYPIVGWGFGLLQIANKIVDCVKRRRLSGIAFAILHIPSYCFHYRRLREPIEWRVIKRYAELSRNGGVLE